MKLKKKPLYNEMQKIPRNDLHYYLVKGMKNFNKFIEKLPKGSAIIISVVICAGLFLFFKWLNRGRVHVITHGDNSINTAILLLSFSLLRQAWELNGEEGMGFGGM